MGLRIKNRSGWEVRKRVEKRVKVGCKEKASNAPFILKDGIRLLRDTVPLPNCVHSLDEGITSLRNRKTAIHPPITRLLPQCHPNPPPADLRVIISFHSSRAPDGQIISTIDGEVRQPVLLCYSCSVQWVCSSLNPRSLHPWEDRNITGEQNSGGIQTTWQRLVSSAEHWLYYDSISYYNGECVHTQTCILVMTLPVTFLYMLK